MRGVPAPGRRWSGDLRTWVPGSGGRAPAVGRAGGGGPPALAPVPPPLPARPRCRFAAAAVCRARAGRVRARALPVTLPVLMDWPSGRLGLDRAPMSHSTVACQSACRCFRWRTEPRRHRVVPGCSLVCRECALLIEAGNVSTAAWGYCSQNLQLCASATTGATPTGSWA